MRPDRCDRVGGQRASTSATGPASAGTVVNHSSNEAARNGTETSLTTTSVSSAPVREASQSDEQYAEWLEDTLVRTLLPDRPAPG